MPSLAGGHLGNGAVYYATWVCFDGIDALGFTNRRVQSKARQNIGSLSCLGCCARVGVVPAPHALGSVSAKAIDRARLKAPARETDNIKLAMQDDMSTRTVACGTVARLQSTLDTEALATVPASSAAASP